MAKAALAEPYRSPRRVDFRTSLYVRSTNLTSAKSRACRTDNLWFPSHVYWMSTVAAAIGWPPPRSDNTPNIKAALGALTGRCHLAFQAQSRAQVDEFHKQALANGGRDYGAPGERDYHPGYYAAFVLDPDGNNIEAVFHGEAKRSAPSVHITF